MFAVTLCLLSYLYRNFIAHKSRQPGMTYAPATATATTAPKYATPPSGAPYGGSTTFVPTGYANPGVPQQQRYALVSF